MGGFVVNEGVVHRTPVANHKSRLQTHHFLGRGRSNVSHLPTPYACGASSFFLWSSVSPDGEKNRDFQNVFLAKLGLLTHFVACAKGQTAKI